MPCCTRCGEDFPIRREPGFSMGKLSSLTTAPEWVQGLFGKDGFLCGTCFHDLEDERLEDEGHA